ncbi:MAG TPA: AAA family ATPase, partial [bacterium]
WVGESEKALRQVFLKARQASPCILFFDELDTIFPRRDGGTDSAGRERLIGQFLAELGGLEPFSEVIVIGSTSRLDLVEPALLNPGRFGFVIDLLPPTPAERTEILRIHMRAIPVSADVAPDRLAEATEGFSAAELATLCQRAGFERLQSFITQHGADAERRAAQYQVRMEDFLRALETLRATQTALGANRAAS